MLKLSTSAIFRLVAVAAIALAIANWWPRALPPQCDGPATSVSWFHGMWGHRTYFKVTGTDRYGGTFQVAVKGLPSYSQMKGAYPDGSPREETSVYVTGSIDGAHIHRKNVVSGKYFSPDGTQIGLVENGTGNVKYCWPDGTPAYEYELNDGEVIRERQWWKNGSLRLDTPYRDGTPHGENLEYYPNGQVRSKASIEHGVWGEVLWYDQTGTETTKPDSLRPFANLL